jgi:alpha-beta hydrolase superfamily lysophospholipase
MRSLAIVPGFSDHAARYGRLVAALRSGVPDLHVFGLDTRGHGRSAGRRGFIERFDDYLDDVDAFLADIRKLRPRDSIFLYGHSMGALIVLAHISARRAGARTLSGAAAGAPPMKIIARLSPAKVKAARLLSSWLPWVHLESDLDVRLLSRDPEIPRAYLADPLVHRKATPRLFTEMRGTADRLLSRPVPLDCPLFLYHGAADGIADPSATRDYGDRVSAPAKQVRIYEGAYHEVHNEPASLGDLARDLVAFMDAHSPARSPADGVPSTPVRSGVP